MSRLPKKSKVDEKYATGLFSIHRLLLLFPCIAVSIFSLRNLSGVSVSKYLPVNGWNQYLLSGTWTATLGSLTRRKITIAYAVSVTGCDKNRRVHLVDGASVVHHSIRLASRRSKYDYKMIAFVHPDAQVCVEFLSELGYEIQIRDTPFNETEIQNEDLRIAQGNSCCGAKEYLKLYSYVLFDYPVVVHLDLDCLVLRPLDDVFDLMLDPSFDRTRIPSMWQKGEEIPEKVDFMFTRDYGMVEPGVRQPHQIGVQGGFLVIRPNQTDFDRNVEVILSGGEFRGGSGWGGPKNYGGYYGAGTIQGLASYYYGEFAQNRSLELNRCYYNNMADNPYGDNLNTSCRTRESECQDCRLVDVRDIYMTHFTNCGKPFWCPNPGKLGTISVDHSIKNRLCMELFREWHLVRLSLENEWIRKYPDYHPVYEDTPNTTTPFGFYLNFSLGHCGIQQDYKPMMYPLLQPGDLSLLPHEEIYR